GYIHLGPAKGDPQFHLYRRADDADRPSGAGGGDWAAQAAAYVRALTAERGLELATALGVPLWSLQELSCGFRGEAGGGGWALLEQNEHREVIGIQRRYESGAKRFMSGGQRGLAMPQGLDYLLAIPCPANPLHGALWVPEGPSDTAALLALRLPAIGRPSNA